MSSPSNNPTFKLYYFNVRALAEPISFLFAYGGQAYEDIRYDRADWPKIKPTMPMGQMPVLEVDGLRVHQSIAICRYVAKRVGLAGANDWESLQIDSAVDTVNDLRQKIAAVHFEADEAIKQQKKEVLESETLPFYLGKLEEFAKQNKGHLAVSKLTWADFYFATVLELFKAMCKDDDILSKYPNLQKVADNVYSLDAIKAWLKKRPVTDL